MIRMAKNAPKKKTQEKQKRYERCVYAGDKARPNNYSEQRPKPKPLKNEHEKKPKKTPKKKPATQKRNINLIGFHNLSRKDFYEARDLIEKSYDKISRNKDPPALYVDISKARIYEVKARLILPGKKYAVKAEGYKPVNVISKALKKLKAQD
jgi:hypothetical protein